MTGAMKASGLLRKAYAQKVTLNVGLWSHWVPEANDKYIEIINEWGKTNNVEINLDFAHQSRDIRSVASAEYHASAGRDVITLCNFDASSFEKKLVPLNDVAE